MIDHERTADERVRDVRIDAGMLRVALRAESAAVSSPTRA
jgi:hypothetical protein